MTKPSEIESVAKKCVKWNWKPAAPSLLAPPTQKPTSPTLLTRWLRFVLADMKNNSVSYLCARLWCLFCKRSSSESPRWFRSCWDMGISAPSFVQ